MKSSSKGTVPALQSKFQDNDTSNLLILFPDGIDGKQARRTGSSTPLGELFDHGSDSVVAAILPPALFCIFGRGEIDYGANVWTLYWICWHIIGCFAISHWEKYLTGVLYLPWGYDISQVVSITFKDNRVLF